jgi:lysophospholipase L1-like esterase
VLLIGDSYFWGYGVDDRFVLSEALQERAGGNVEVINGAVTGYGTDQELLWLVNEGLRYRPDIVVLGFFPGNDVVEICASLSYGYPKPYYTYEQGRLTVHNVPVPDTRKLRNKWTNEADTAFERLKRWLRHHVHLYQLVTSRLNSLPALRALFVKAGLARSDDFILPADIPRYQLTDQEKKMDLSDALIREMKRTAEKAGAKFLLVFIPNKEYDPGHPVGYSQMVGYGKDAYDISTNFPWNSSSSEYLHRMARKERIDLLDLLPVVRSAHRQGVQFYFAGPEDHHWSAAGHRVAADAIYDRLAALGWLH